MKLIHLKALIIIIMASTSIVNAQDLVIASPSQTAAIYVNAGTASVSWHAATELQRCIFIMTGKTLPINANPISGPQIVIGTLANPLVKQDSTALHLTYNANDEQTAVLRKGNNLFLAGKTARAALYATYTFMQDYLGVRWLWPGDSGEFIPKRTSITVGTLGLFQVPQLPIRTLAISNATHGSYPDTETWMARNRMNVISWELGDTSSVRKRKGFMTRFSGHNIVLPVDTLNAHPTWAALRNGVRLISAESHLCWGNTEVQTAVANMIKGWWTDNPLLDIAHIYPADNQNYCTDALCQSLGADYSTRWQNFTKAVIAKVELTHPNKRYWTYAYQGYKGVPQTTAAPFEFVGYALYEACYRHDYLSTGDATNTVPNTEINGWLTKDVNMGIRGYEYIMFTDPMFAPLVKWEVDQMDALKNKGLVGYMSELRPYGRPSGPAENTNWATNRINLYAAARAMWSPVSADSIVNDWNNTIYGVAGPHMRDYYKTFDTAWRNATQHISIYNNAPVNVAGHFLSIPTLVKLNNHIRIARTTIETGVTDTALANKMYPEVNLESKMLLNWQTMYNYRTERAYRYTTSVINVPGTVDWNDPDIPQLPVFENSDGQTVSEQTDVKMIWNSTNLVLHVVCHDNDVANRTLAATAHDDGDILTDDRIEIYLQKDPNSPEYVRLAVNAKSPTPWRYDASSKGGTNWIISWTPSPAWSSSVTTTTSSWTATITIPFSALGITPAANTQFKMMIKRGRPEGNSGWPDGSFYNQNSFGLVKLVNEIDNPVYNRVILYDENHSNRFPISVEFQKRGWQVSSGVSGETALSQKLNEDASVLLIRYTSGNGIALSNTYFQNEIVDFISKGRVVILSGTGMPVNNWFTGLPSLTYSSSVGNRVTIDTLSGQWLRIPNNIRTLVKTGITPNAVYIPATGWQKLATVGMTSGGPQPYLLTYRIGDGLLVVTTSGMGYTGGFEMFGSSTPLNAVKLVENLRSVQDSIYSYSLSTLASVDSSGTQALNTAGNPGIFKVVKADQSSVYTIVQASRAGEAIIKITDLQGRILISRKVHLGEGYNTISIPASIANGQVYIATLITQDQIHSVKFLQQ